MINDSEQLAIFNSIKLLLNDGEKFAREQMIKEYNNNNLENVLNRYQRHRAYTYGIKSVASFFMNEQLKNDLDWKIGLSLKRLKDLGRDMEDGIFPKEISGEVLEEYIKKSFLKGEPTRRKKSGYVDSYAN